MDAITEGHSASRVASANTHWSIWSAFCANVSPDPQILSCKDRTPILSTFAAEYHCGNISDSGKNVGYCMVKDSVCSIGQALAAMGVKDPRQNSEGVLEIRLKYQYMAYSKQDPPPNHVKPVPFQILRHIASIASASAN